MEFLSQTYVALRGPTGAPQTASETVGKLSDRLSPATLLADRRAAVLSLKGLARDHKHDVGERALPGLLQVLYNDAEVDADIGKAALETLHMLCDVEEDKELGLKYTDAILENEQALHALVALLADNNFYTRFATLQLLSTLLQNRRQRVQAYFLTAAAGPRSIVAVLEDKREIIRNEAIAVVQSIISQSADIQKVLAFEGAFEKLFNIISQEGGVDGGQVAQEALTCLDSFLRLNSSNQSYFRETGLPSSLLSLLLFPPNLPIQEPAPQEFALQFWDDQKLANASAIVGIIGLLVGSKSQGTQEQPVFVRCLIEIALASNAPTELKTKALNSLPATLNFPLFEFILTPYMPVPETNGEEWDRLEAATALDALVELALHGEYNGLDAGKRSIIGLNLRSAAVAVFENFIRKEEVKQAFAQSMLPQDDAERPSHPLLQALVMIPSSDGPLDLGMVTATHFASLLFSHLIRNSPRTKSLARSIKPQTGGATSASAGSGNFFVPADGPTPGQAPAKVEEPDDDDEPPQTICQMITENLSLSFLARSRANNSDRESREWDRLIVAYLCLLSQWLWEEPGAVRDFLEAGGLGVLVEPANNPSEDDLIVPGLSLFLLGICYEFNREPGEITRHTIYPILNRLGVDTSIGRLSRLREDDRFKAVSPEVCVLPFNTTSKAEEREGEIWFDWAFVDFWKSNYYTIQRGLSTEPGQLASPSGGQTAELTMLVSSLREVIHTQAQEIETLKAQLKQTASANDQIAILQKDIAKLTTQLQESEEKRKETEKEHEDLLVLVDEVSSMRARDKVKMREAGLEVSDDEGEEDDEDDE
ncbi:Vesicle-mediated ER to Golgi transport protein [Marasmius crinis-equi]|uniref:Vesicle-mediated ER to Golgi transport protein n=1 Tax=Marasmius crinis-equi TaxID=585013 RepID=A0ABR3FJK4_9AGAR